MKLKVSWASSRNRRKENQDNLSIGEQAAFPEGIEERHISGQVLMDIRENNEVLFAAADGLGGCTNGKYAAARCLESLRESFYSFYNTSTETEAEEQTALCEPLHTCTAGESPLPVLRPVSQLLPLRAASLLLEHEEEAEPAPSRLMAAAMEARNALAETYRDLDGGCTLCAVSVCANGEVEWVSAGDSGIWLLHSGKLTLINHPLDNRYYSHKALGLPADPKEKSVLLNYLGAADADLHTGSFSLHHGDTLVLCTDGVDLEKTLSRFLLKLNGSADQLCAISNASDNATAVLIRFV